MQQPILQIRDKLFTGLDQEYNVVDMGIVVDVLSQLENYAITKEALEATRLGKHINELRRKAQDKLLANRAKSLVKKWRQLLVVSSESPSAAPVAAAAVSAGSGQPQLQQNGRHHHLSPAIRPNGLRVTTSPAAPLIHSLPSSASTSPGLSRPSTPTGRINGRSSSPVQEQTQPSGNHHHHLLPSKTNSANKRLRKATTSPPSNSNSLKRPRLNGEDTISSKASNKSAKPPSEREKPDTLQRQMLSVRKASGKVLTTQDLVQQLALRSQSPALQINNNNNNINNSNSNGVHNTEDDNGESHGMEASSLYKAEDTPLPSSQLESNSQLMSRFFDSQEEEEEEEERGRRRLSPGPPSSERTSPDQMDSSTRSSSAVPGALLAPSGGDEVDAILSQLPPINRDEILAQMQREFQGECDANTEDEEEDDIQGLIPVKREPLKTLEVTEELVQRLHTEQVESLTGNFDTSGAFHEWHEVVGKTSKEGDLLYILPYCIID